MVRIFKGLCICGAWGCFDEFNRLSIDVMSSISQTIYQIQSALFRRDDKVCINGDSFALKHTSGLFLTMNPDYNGRNILPDNICKLFLPILAEVPNSSAILEMLLSTYGFSQSKTLSKKLIDFF